MIDSNPAKVYEHQIRFNDLVYAAVSEIGNHYFDTYVFDCQANQIQKLLKEKIDDEHDPFVMLRFCTSSNEIEYQPVMQIIKPPDIKTNPYTGKPMPKENSMYKDGQVDVEGVKKWLTSNMPNYSTVIRTVAQAKEFTNELHINKVFLFTNKKKTPPIY